MKSHLVEVYERCKATTAGLWKHWGANGHNNEILNSPISLKNKPTKDVYDDIHIRDHTSFLISKLSEHDANNALESDDQRINLIRMRIQSGKWVPTPGHNDEACNDIPLLLKKIDSLKAEIEQLKSTKRSKYET